MKKKEWLKNLPYKKDIKKAKIPYKKEVGIALIINLVVVLTAGLLVFRLPPQIPLLYGLPEGEEQLVPSWCIIVPNLTSLLIIVLNSVLSNSVKDNYLKKILIFSGFASTFFATITTLKIFFLVGNL